MKKLLLFLFINFSVVAQNYQRTWGSYSPFDDRGTIIDSKVDSQGNLYIVGQCSEIHFININNPYHNDPIGNSDGYIMKYNNTGELIWGTYVGGERDDAVSSIAIDANDAIYILGTTNSELFIASANAYQPTKGAETDFMLAKFESNGILAWSTYYGGNGFDGTFDNNWGVNGVSAVLTHDTTNNIYLAGITGSTNLGTSGTFQPIKGTAHGVITKFNDSGTLLWATYYTRNSDDYITSLSASETALYVAGTFDECDNAVSFPVLIAPSIYYGTIDGFLPQSDVCATQFLSKFNFSGQRVWSTYYENYGINISSAHSVATYHDKIYLSGSSLDGNMASSGAFQTNVSSNPYFTPYLAQFNEDGTRNWATYNGLSGIGNIEDKASVSVDQEGNAYLYAGTSFTQNVATANAYQENINSTFDGFISKFDTNGQKLWGTYYGGEKYDNIVSCNPYQNGFYVAGYTNSTTSIATSINGTPPGEFFLHDESPENPHPYNVFVAKFEVISLTSNNNQLKNLQLYPNPNKGNFNIKGNFSGLQNLEIAIYDNQCRTIYSKKVIGLEDTISLNLENKVQSGMYFVKIFNSEFEKTIKMMIE